MVKALSRGRQVKARALESSAILVALMVAGAAFAQCTPDPTQANATTTCTGTDSNGLVVTTSASTVNVAAGASVTNTGAPAIRYAIPVSNSSYAYSTLTVGGRVDGGNQTGVQLLRQSSSNGYGSLNLSMTVAAGGSVSGANGVVIGQTGTDYGQTTATIDNNGTISGTGTGTNGYALLSTNQNYAGFQSITNRAGGTIGAISGSIGTLTNAGTIDGGSRSAIDSGATYSSAVYGSGWTNSGTISNNSTAATLANYRGSTLTNSGTISNAGTGAVIVAPSGNSLSLVNQAGGRIATAGTTAIQGDSGINLVNSGTVVGDIVSTAGQFSYSSTIDNAAGTITGNVRFGTGNDTLIVGYANGAIRTGISGTIDGGAGTDTLRVRFTSDATLSSALTLPTNFEQLVLAPDAKMTTTLARGFTVAGPLRVGGSGTVVNNTALSGTGTVLTDEYSSSGSPGFTNAGSIAGTVTQTGGFIVALSSVNRFENSGTVTATGNGVSSSSNGAFVNSGTITATGTAVSLFGPSFTNSGTIRSTGGIGATLSGSYGSTWTNSGRIEGTTAGLQLSSGLTNSGTITATGTGVFISYYGSLTNAAGGVVTGGTRAIAPNGNFAVSNASIANAGTINGDVTFGPSSSGSFYGNNNTYYALAGGVLNGNLTLSNGDLLVAEMTGTSGNRFAGITGTVSGASAGLRLRVRSDATATLPATTSFATVGYELFDKAALTLTGTGASRPLTLAGQGTVDLTADIATTTGPAITATSRSVAPGETYAANALTVTSRGALSLAVSSTNVYSTYAVSLGSDDGFTNAGTISVTDTRSNNYNALAAISGGKTVTNDGTITLDGAIGIRYAQTVTNSGRIVQATGGRAATGVSNFTALTNSGTIEVGGTAILLDYGPTGYQSTIENSGRIASTGGIAIAQSYSGNSAMIRNLAGGTIAGATGQNAIRISGGQVSNAGTITGDVDLGYASYGGRSYSSAIYTGNGGTLTGNLRFGDGNDVFVEMDGQTGVTGTIDGGAGTDIYRRAFTKSGTVTLGSLTAVNFERQDVQAIGADTVVTVGAGAALASLGVLGDGQIVNTANVDGDLTIGNSYYYYPQPQQATLLAALTNQAIVKGGVSGQVALFTNSGTIGDAALKRSAVSLYGTGAMTFANSGTILNDVGYPGVNLSVNAGTITATNSGTVAQGLSAFAWNYNYYGITTSDAPQPLKVMLTNTGTIATTADRRSGVQLTINDNLGVGGSIQFDNSGTVTQGVNAYASSFTYYNTTPPETAQGMGIAVTNSGSITASGDGREAALLTINDSRDMAGSITLTNSGTIEASGVSGDGVSANFVGNPASTTVQSFAITNSGTIRANAGGRTIVDPYAGASVPVDRDAPTTIIATGVSLYGKAAATATVVNSTTGVIEATGAKSVALLADGVALDLTNAGTIRGTTGTTLAANDTLARWNGTTIAGAIQTIGSADNRIVNTGTIIGSIALGAGNDRIENYGQIQGNVFLGAGDDTFLHRASATLVGTVDGGAGTDSLIIDATGGGTVNGDQFVNFERFSQTGQGNVTYAGAFNFDTLGVAGGSVTVAAGQTLTSTGATTITGTDAAETVTNNGTIAGAVSLGGGDDRFVNAGLVQGAVALGDGNDSFVEGAGSRVVGGVDGGAGTNLYTALLSGDRSGLGQRSNFQQLAVTGAGTLSLTLDQSFDTVALAGTGLNVALAGNRIGAVTGTDAAEQLRVDGDIASVALGAGGDLLALGVTNAAGQYDGGAGTDTLRFTANAAVVLSGVATGFENVSLTGNALTVAGSLGTQGAPLNFGDSDLSLTVAKGGTLAGVIDLGAGNDALRLAAGSVLLGTVAGGSGNDSATLELAGNQTLAAGQLTGFETLATEGTGNLTLTGAHAYNQVNAATDLTIASGSSLTATQVAFTGGNQRFTIAGTFAGAVDGGAGTDSIALSAGTATAPVAFTNVANVEALAMTGSYATVSGNASFGAVDMAGGRLVGLAGSTMAATQFLVRQGATFGSAGTVNGNVTVAGTLSPGASPGTMTVNGNVTLNSGSLSYFELTPTVSDKLIVNGGLTIGSGSTLQIVSSGALRPGTSYDLIVASGGISGSYSNVLKPSDLFGFIVQRADRIQLLGQFLGDARFSPQVARSIDYANATLSKQSATSTLFAALPSLLTASGASNPRGFSQITPEAYASATQIGVDNALGLAQAARGPAFATTREDAGVFTFGQTLGQWHMLGADAGQGTSAARTRGYGFLGGVGYGDRQWMIGAFGGWLDTRQSIAPLGASTKADGVVAGVHGRYSMPNGFGFGASVVYDGAQARTTRALPGTASAYGRYDLHSWTSDLSVHYAAELAEGWSLTPRAGLTYLRTRRQGMGETGGSPFALTVARRDLVAGFADGGVTFGRSDASDAPFRPFVTLGARYQIEGNRAVALGGYAGGGLGLVALGAARAPLVGTATGGVAYRFTNGVDLYATGSAQTGRDDHQETITAGLRLRF